MAKDRYSGKGSLVKANVSGDGTTMVTVGLIRNITPPPEKKAIIDLTAMEDTNFVGDTGIEEQSTFQFTTLDDPGDTGDAGIDTLYASGASVKWQIISTVTSSAGTTKTWTQDFTGRVVAKEPQGFGGNDPRTKNVTVVRTGAITDTIA